METSEFNRKRVVLNSKEKKKAGAIIDVFTPKMQDVSIADIEGSLDYDIAVLGEWFETDSQSRELIRTVGNIDKYDYKEALNSHMETPLTLYRRNGKLYVVGDGTRRIMLALAKYQHEMDELYDKYEDAPSQEQIDEVKSRYSIKALVYEGDADVKVADAMHQAAEEVMNSLTQLSRQYVLTYVKNDAAGARLVYIADMDKYEVVFQGQHWFSDADGMVEFLQKTSSENKGFCCFTTQDPACCYITGDNVAYKTQYSRAYEGLIKTFHEYRDEYINPNYLVEVLDGGKEEDLKNVHTARQQLTLAKETADALETFANKNQQHNEVLNHKALFSKPGDAYVDRWDDHTVNIPVYTYVGLNGKEFNALAECLSKMYNIAGISEMVPNDKID